MDPKFYYNYVKKEHLSGAYIIQLNHTACASRNRNVFTAHLKESVVFSDLIDTGRRFHKAGDAPMKDDRPLLPLL